MASFYSVEASRTLDSMVEVSTGSLGVRADLQHLGSIPEASGQRVHATDVAIE